jgi:hypothetical protein
VGKGVERGFEVGRLTDHGTAAPFNAPPDLIEQIWVDSVALCSPGEGV